MIRRVSLPPMMVNYSSVSGDQKFCEEACFVAMILFFE